MSNPYLSEIRIFSFGFAPKGWAFCNGQILPINQNAALFSLMGTFYGGNGQSTFALPNLQGRLAVHVGTGFGSSFVQGQTGGESSHTLLVNEMPLHTHLAAASSDSPDSSAPTGNFWASNTGDSPYGTTISETMSPQALATTGGSQPHQNMSPYLVLNFCIALQGIFPSRN
jgi:microcystin-dependent protein